MSYAMTSQSQVRAAFWRMSYQTRKPRRFAGLSQNDLPTDLRVMFVDYVDALQKAGHISERLAYRVTL
jgi:hypothetical protein